MLKIFTDENGNIIEVGGGWVFVNDSCMNDLGISNIYNRYSVKDYNGKEYYDNDGIPVKFNSGGRINVKTETGYI